MTDPKDADAGDLLDVKEAAEEFGLSERSIWAAIKTHDLTRYKVPARPRKTLIRRDELRRALYTPVPIRPAADQDAKKAAA